MQQTPTRTSPAPARLAALTLIAAAVLSACGGGGGDPSAVPAKSGVSNGAGTGTTGGTPAVTETRVGVVMVDGSGNTVTSLSGGQSGTLKATVLTPDGRPAANAIVQFATGTPGLVVFVPDTGSALTDANGVAVMTVKPASIGSAGALALSATSVVEGKTGSSGVNISIGAAPLTLGTLEVVSKPAGALPAFSTVALRIPVSSGGRPANVSTGLVLGSDCAGMGSATLVPGAINDGVQLATYTNKGCTLGTDIITASIGNSVQRATIEVGTANIGSIQFSGSSAPNASIVLKGSGGEGRSESAQVNFRVVDQQGNGLAGVPVKFSATTYTGGLAVSPDSAMTDAAGNVSATVSSGSIPTPVRVVASAVRNGVSISGLSDALTISTGLPSQKWMSMSVGRYNIEGDAYDGETTPVTIMLADQYGNPVSDNTAVSVVTEGGAVGSAVRGGCTTANGACSVELRSQAFRPADGRVTLLAFAQGMEEFTDLDGNGQYSGSGEFNPTTQDLPDAFLDANFNGVYDPADGDLPFPYGHSDYRNYGTGTWGMNYMRRSVEIVFSGSTAFPVRQVCAGNTCRDWTASDGDQWVVGLNSNGACAETQLVLRVKDRHDNPMPYGTTLAVVAPVKITVPLLSPDNIASTNNKGGTLHFLTVKPDASCAAGSFTLQIKTPKGNISQFMYTTN